MRFRTFAYSSRIELRLYLADCSLEFLQSSTLGSDIRLRRLKRFRLFCERGAAIRVPRFFALREDAARAVNIRRLIFLFFVVFVVTHVCARTHRQHDQRRSAQHQTAKDGMMGNVLSISEAARATTFCHRCLGDRAAGETGPTV